MRPYRSMPLALVLAVVAATLAVDAGDGPVQAAQPIAKKRQSLRLAPAAAIEALKQVRRGGTTRALDLTCQSDGSSNHCATKFVAACDEAGGGMSTNPDGSVTCSMP